jgi:hypothetical protein
MRQLNATADGCGGFRRFVAIAVADHVPTTST